MDQCSKCMGLCVPIVFTKYVTSYIYVESKPFLFGISNNKGKQTKIMKKKYWVGDSDWKNVCNSWTLYLKP